MNEAAPVIDVRGLTKVYRTEEVETHALTGIELSIQPGEYIAAMGPSGCGKTTLLSILGLLETPSGGEYQISGTPVETLNAGERARMRNRHIGFVFQAFNLVPTLTAAENITLPADIAGRQVDAAWRDEVVGVLGIGARLGHRPAELSGGEQQRVAVARALVGRPEVVFADEPTGNLDSRAGAELLGFLAEAVTRYGQSVVMVTHDPVAAGYADRVVFLADGAVVDELADPTPATVGARMQAIRG